MKKCSVPFTLLLILGVIDPLGFRITVSRLHAQGGPNPPQIVSETGSMIVQPGENVEFEVRAVGDGPPKYQWFFNGQPIRGAKDPLLIIPQAEPRRVGTYFAIVSNPGGEVQSRNMNLSLRREQSSGIGFRWVSRYHSGQAGRHISTDLVGDEEGNVYVVGEVPNEQGHADMAIIKYDSDGVEQWLRTFDPSQGQDDRAHRVGLLSNGNLVIAGTINFSGTPQIVALSLNPTGQVVWTVPLTGDTISSGEAVDLATGPNGITVITGTSISRGNRDIATFQVSANGEIRSANRFDGGGDDEAASVAIDGAGNFLIVGTSAGEGSGDDMISVLYNQRGIELWNNRQSSADAHDDFGRVARFDSQGRPIAIGARFGEKTGLDIAVTRYSTTGNIQFNVTESSRGTVDDLPTTAVIDGSDAILIAGDSRPGNRPTEAFVVKLDRNGSTEWTRFIPSPKLPGDRIVDSVGTDDGGIVIAGARTGQDLGLDMANAKIDTRGDLEWDVRLSLIPNLPVFEASTGIDLDSFGDVILTGISNTQSDSTGVSPGRDTQIITARQQVTVPTQNTLPVVRITQPIPNQLFQFGDEITISAVASDAEGPVMQVEFLVGERLIGTDRQAPFQANWIVDTVEPLFISARVTDANGAVVATGSPILLNVVDISPEIVAFPGDQLVAPGSTVTLVSQVTGQAPLRFFWAKNRRPIPGANGPTLVIENFRAENAGRYEMLVENLAGRDRSPEIRLELNIPSIPAGDGLAQRVALPGESGQLKVSTINATREPGEPNHANKPGGSSVWFSYVAPANGLVTLSTIGADFDTLLAIYTGTSFNNLVDTRNDEDSAGGFTSQVQFRVNAGQEYLIAIDGFNRQQGTVILSWEFDRTILIEIPRLTIGPDDIVANRGDNVTFGLNLPVAQRPANLELQWLFNGDEVIGETGDTLTISNAQRNNVGRYALRARVDTLEATSNQAKLSLAARQSVDQAIRTEVLIENKFADLFFSLPGANGQAAQPLRRGQRRPIPLAASLATGFSGAQVFNTFGAVKEIDEPDHCDVPGGASQWFAYQPPIDGNVAMTTNGSDFDTVLAVYQTDSSDFTSMVEVACDNDSGLDGQDSSLTFTATANTIYYIAVDGVDAATGVVELAYAMILPIELSLTAGGGVSFGNQQVTEFTYTITAVPNVDFALEVSDDLFTWTTVLTGQADANGTFQFSDEDFNLLTAGRYFRVFYP